MGYLVIDNFGDGLDSRRTLLTTKAGALLKCKNAHVTRGKEIEKRKRFSPFATLPSNTFGMHAAAGALYVFGSENISSTLIPSGVTYQRLVHPSGATISMSEIIYTESFNGLVYAVARYADGSIYHFFNGTRVAAWDTVAASVATLPAVASALASQIDAETEFAATASGNVITVTGPVNKTFSLALAAVNGGSINDQAMSQTTTQSASALVSQITTVTISGTFEANDRYSINATIAADGYSKQFSISASAAGVARTVKTFGSKMYGATQSLLYFTQIGDPTAWGGTTSGAGFINVLNQDGGAENLTAMAVYQGRLALFSRRTIQVWNMDADPSKNVQVQTLNNIGTFAPRSVVAFGDVDVFFLSDSGVRSIRARDSSNAATVSDIGTAIDTLIQDEMRSFSDAEKAAACGIIEPNDGRYWLAIGNKIFVFSSFSGSGVAAWSTYEPGFTISNMAYLNGRVYVRSENQIYLYGGASGNEYDNCEVEVVIPFLDGGKPAHVKQMQAIDMACDGTWDIFVGTDTSAPEAKDYAGQITNSTYALNRLLCFSVGTHMGIRLVSAASGYARLGNMALHYEIAQPE